MKGKDKTKKEKKKDKRIILIKPLAQRLMSFQEVANEIGKM